MAAKLKALWNGNGPTPAWTDDELVRECLEGNQQAWSALVDKYKQLVYSIPLKYQAPPEDAADIFQAVWMELHAQLRRLRTPGALRGWLIQVATHQCYHWKLKQRQESLRDGGAVDVVASDKFSPQLVEEVEREQMLREAIMALPPRCQELIRMLFYEQPPLPYDEVARRFGLAAGSIGFIRGRCLARLRTNLQNRGF